MSQEYDKNVIKHLVSIINIVEKLGEYFSIETKEKLSTITSMKDGISPEHETFIITLKSQIDDLVIKLERLKTLSNFHFKEGENVSEKLPQYIIDIRFFETLNSDKTRQAIDALNNSVKELQDQAGILQGKINVQRKEIEGLIEKHQKHINTFLAYASYRYKVEIVGIDDKLQLKLMHIDYEQHLTCGNQHLSFGEKNAFAVILFMYECLAKKPDLIILDDPISSFDKNKKYAILEMLFRRDAETCLKSKTVLMLTHDIEPIIDTLKSVRDQFNNQVNASYLRLNKGKIEKQIIRSNDIKIFSQICQDVLSSSSDPIIKLIYLRRHYEILDAKGDAYQVLSNLFHKRKKPIDTRQPKGGDNPYPEMESDKFASGESEIKERIQEFNYDSMLENLSDLDLLTKLYHKCRNGYKKLQLFRLLKDKVKNPVIKKFINETFHIENEFICQLDPNQFDLIPEYIIDECDKSL